MNTRVARMSVGLVISLFAGSLALGAPATPAVPHGGNPHNDNPNAATPATPGAHGHRGGGTTTAAGGTGATGGTFQGGAPAGGAPAGGAPNGDVRRLVPRETGELLDQHPDVRAQVQRKWQTVTSGEKTSFLRTHPMWRMEYFALPWERLTTAQRGDFVACQPAFMLTLQLRWDGWEPEQRTIFVRKHPGVDVRIGWRGEGRDARRGGRGDQQRGDRARPMGPGQGVDRGRHGGEGGQSGGGQEQGGREGRGR